MRKDFISSKITSKATYVEYGYGQVEPNHLANQATKQSYGQLPAAASIEVLENGEFAKYDYANGEVNFTGDGEWMLVWNEIKHYREDQLDCEFALKKDDYQARVYSPFDGVVTNKQSRYYDGKDSNNNTSITINGKTYAYDDVTKNADIYDIDYNKDPFHIEGRYHEQMMKTGTSMMPRVLKTEIGDIFTTNTITGTTSTIIKGAKLVPTLVTNSQSQTIGCVLAVKATPAATDMVWKVVKVYTMPDGQRGAKVMRIQ